MLTDSIITPEEYGSDDDDNNNDVGKSNDLVGFALPEPVTGQAAADAARIFPSGQQ